MKAALTFEHHVFSVSEAAEHLRISRSFLYRLFETGKIKPVKIGKRTIVTGAEIMRFLNAAEDATPELPTKTRHPAA